MTGQQLKNSILQWAIQGKLVPQIESEGTAEDLLKEIRAEKEKLVKEGKLKKKDLEVKPIEEDEIPFEIPEGWRWCRLGELASFVVDCPHSTPQKSSCITNHPCIRTSEIKGGVIVWDSMQYLDEANYKLRISRLKPQEGDIVYAREGVYGDAVILPSTHEFCLGQRTMMLRMALRSITEYIHKAIISPFGYSQAVKLNREGTTSVGHVNMSDIVNFLFPLPPLSEQKRIVSKIEELMPLVEEYGKAQERLNVLNKELPEKLKKSVLQEAIMGKLVPQDPKEGTADELLERLRRERKIKIDTKQIKLTKPEKSYVMEPIPDDFVIPESWQWCCINDVCRVFGRIGFRGYTKEDIVSRKELGAISISPSNMKKGALDLTNCTYITRKKYEESPEIMVENGDVLLVKTASVGKVALIKNLPWISTINPQIALLKEISIDKEFLCYMLLSPYAQKKFIEYAIGTSIPTFSQEKILGFVFPLPPLAEQKRIVEKLNEILGKIVF
ncbi:MAG: restriction endonuclease subunit S [Paludibacteraceae bacterium]|nr:restriction endonuclease subunit S [Paludibacteraceae bacterium]